MQTPRVLIDTPEYQIQNFPPSSKEGRLPPREGGKFHPRVYSSNEDLNQTHLSPEEFRQTFNQPTESREGSVIERMPISCYGTGNRRVYKKDTGDDKKKKGM